MFTALGDPTRQALFQRLGQGPASVGTLARGLPVTRPAVSQHLKVLKEAGLVQSRAAGTRRIYQLDPRGVEAMRGYLDLLWGRALDALKTLSEEETP
jgi:DNA-binding transcriptional ArsR family regulator